MPLTGVGQSKHPITLYPHPTVPLYPQQTQMPEGFLPARMSVSPSVRQRSGLGFVSEGLDFIAQYQLAPRPEERKNRLPNHVTWKPAEVS